FRNVNLVDAGQKTHYAIFRRRKRLADIAGDGGDDASLQGSVAEDFRVGDDVIGVTAASGTIDVSADFMQHRRRLQPVGVLRRQLVYRLQSPEQLHREIANALGKRQIGAIVLGRGKQGI